MSDSGKLVEDIRSLNVSGESNDDKAAHNFRSGKQQEGGHETVASMVVQHIGLEELDKKKLPLSCLKSS